jgi:zinc D-Ala-D-Ala dipeptidase
VIRWDKTKGRAEPIRALNRVREEESGEELVDLLEMMPDLRLGRPHVVPFMRRKVAEMLVEVQSRLPEGIHLALLDAWRPLERQQRIYDFMWAAAKEAYPSRDHASLRRTVCRWVAPTDQKAPPGHCTGGAVDVQLVDDKNEALEVSAPYDRFTAAPTYSFGLTEEAHRNRMLLVETMLSVGFSNCRDEWWHYSYGDAGWAVRMGLDRCFYGLAELAPELYEEAERKHAEGVRDRPNPFLPPA